MSETSALENKKVMVVSGVRIIPYPPIPTFDDRYDKLWVQIVGRTPVAGPCADSIDHYRAMLDARLKNKRLTQEAYDQLIAMVLKSQQESMEKAKEAEGTGSDEEKAKAASAIAEKLQNINTFARGPNGELGFSCVALHAMVRECFSELDLFKRGKAWRDRFDLGIEVGPWFTPILRDGQPITEIDSIETKSALAALGELNKADELVTRPCHVMTRTGPLHSLKTREVVNTPWSVMMLITKRRGSPITHADILEALGCLPTVRLGADRSQMYGGCDVGFHGLAEESKFEGLSEEQKQKDRERKEKLEAEKKAKKGTKKHAAKNRSQMDDDPPDEEPEGDKE